MLARDKVAKLAGVSPETVSRVFRGFEKIAPATREKVLKVGRRCGYVPHSAARAMRRGKFQRIACIAPRHGGRGVPTSGYIAYLDAAAFELAEFGYSLVFEPFCLDPESNNFLEPPRLFSELAVDGVLGINSSGDIPLQLDRQIARMGAPVVWVNRDIQPGIPCVAADEVANARILTRHLIDLGHRHIGYCSYFGTHYSVADRPQGIKEELRAAGLEERGIMISPPETKAYRKVETVERLLNLQPRPTAVICYDRFFYDLTLHQAARRGWRVPQDISVCYFASTWEITEGCPMTALIIPNGEMVKISIRLLMDILSGKTVRATQNRVVGTLRTGESTGPAPKNNEDRRKV